MARQVNVPVGAAQPGETAPRRNYKVQDGPLVRPVGTKCSTVYEFIVECFERGGNRRCMGWREVRDIHKEVKPIKKIVQGKETIVDKTWMYYEMADYQYQTFTEVLSLIHSYGRGLTQIGLTPGSEDKLHIFASTSHKWMKTYLASQTQAIPIVTAYDTLGEKGLTHSLVQTESKAIFTDNALLVNLINPLKKADHVKYIIHSEPIDPNDKRQDGELYQQAADAVLKIQEIRPDIKFYSYDQVIELGDKNANIPPHPPKPEDLSCIMYTSGSTGDPKGVVLKHSNVVAGVAGVGSIITRQHVTQEDRIIAFLPLAHIFEMVFELITFWWGGCLGYATVKTLTDSSVRNCKSDLTEFKPTIMVGVAAVWEMVRKGVIAKVKDQSPVAQKVFWAAYHAKLSMKKYGIPGGDIVGNIIFKKVKQATGGQLRLVLNGGSPLSRDAQEFVTTLLAPMLIGYGLTETVANTCVLSPDDFEYECAGMLTGAITVKLVDVPELGYFAKNNQGEVWIKGAPVLSEYYKNEEETQNALTADGWFQTGDIGQWTKTGQLKVIDRKKNLVKTMNGEYIALEKLESIYRSNEYVGNICVYADQSKVKPVGIVMPQEPALAKLAISMGIIEKPEQINTALHKKELVDAVLTSILKTGKSQGLAGIELLLGITFFDEEWTPQNGYVTSAQKLQRKKILEHVKEDVDKLYS